MKIFRRIRRLFLKYFNLHEKYLIAILFPCISVIIIVFALTYIGMHNKGLQAEWGICICAVTVLLVLIGIVIYVARNLMFEIKKSHVEKKNECFLCASDYKKFIFTKHRLVDLGTLIKREKALADNIYPEECAVWNFTTLRDTYQSGGQSEEEETINIIKHNIHRGVRYKVFYTDSNFVSSLGKNLELYGRDNLISCEEQPKLFSNSNFDYLLHIYPDKKIKGYVAVNFTSQTELCGACPHKNSCDYHNDKVFYRILTDDETAYVYNSLSKMIKDKE